jgi:hypothetical protein
MLKDREDAEKGLRQQLGERKATIEELNSRIREFERLGNQAEAEY